MLIGVVYASIMFATFFFFEFDMMNRFCREYLGLTPTFSLPFIIPCSVNVLGVVLMSNTATIIGSTYTMFVSSSTTWLTLLKPPNPYVNSGITLLKIYRSYRVLTALGNNFSKRLVVTLHHTGLNLMCVLISFLYIRYPEKQTIATIIGFPISLAALFAYEYLEIELLSRASIISREFIHNMQSSVSRSSGYWKKSVRLLQPLEIQLYYPIRKTNKKAFTHFVFTYTINTFDLLLAFK
jgi:hypothetical protein